VDIAAREPLRVKELLVDEGDLVHPGQIVVRMDTVTLEAQLAEARAQVAAAKEKIAVAASNIASKKSEIQLAQIEADRSRKLVEERAGSQRELDVRTMNLETTRAALTGEQAQLAAAQEEVKVAEANGAAIQTRIDDAVLTSPVTGRVLYRLAEPGEVLGAGGKALTVVNLEDVYMEIFLPAAEAARLKMGADARLTLDHEPGRSGPAYVSFVSPEAQFTPKEVETRSEREKLMFRVKIQVPKELVTHYIEYVKTGTRGVGYVKVDPDAAWPDFLEKGLLRAPQEGISPYAPTANR
jgi:HlyD family secretion protein